MFVAAFRMGSVCRCDLLQIHGTEECRLIQRESGIPVRVTCIHNKIKIFS